MHLGVLFGSALLTLTWALIHRKWSGRHSNDGIKGSQSRVRTGRLRIAWGQDDPNCWIRPLPESARYSHMTGWGRMILVWRPTGRAMFAG